MGERLRVSGLRKTYGATVALSQVNFTVGKGEVHAIIGENGAGKSTLIKILSGMVERDEGTILLNGSAYFARNINDARRQGVSTAFQELSLVANLTIAENLALPRMKTNAAGFISAKQNNEMAEALLSRYELGHLSPKMPVGDLSLAEKQKLEIVRALRHEPKLLLLDEPTAALPDPEWLFRIMNRYKETEMSILYISHRLAEIRELCSRGTILRNGASIDTVELNGVSDKEIFKMMVGRESTFQVKREGGNRRPEPCLEAEQLSGDKISQVSFALHGGEIVGVAGLEGQGQSELFKILAGVEQPRSGRIKVKGKAVKLKSPRAALKHGIAFVAEERKSEGILPGLSTLSNITVSSLKKASKFQIITNGTEYPPVRPYQEQVQLDARYVHKKIESLSGGNQQKAIMARVLMCEPDCQLLYDPTRGVDVGTKEAFYDQIRSYADGGGSVLWYSTDLHELETVCDRILVFYKGEIVLEAGRNEMNSETLLSAAMGHQHAQARKEAAT